MFKDIKIARPIVGLFLCIILVIHIALPIYKKRGPNINRILAFWHFQHLKLYIKTSRGIEVFTSFIEHS